MPPVESTGPKRAWKLPSVGSTPKKFPDTGKGKLEKTTLTKDWQRYEIDVSTQDLTRIKTGFVWTLASPGHAVTFYLDDIRWE